MSAEIVCVRCGQPGATYVSNIDAQALHDGVSRCIGTLRASLAEREREVAELTNAYDYWTGRATAVEREVEAYRAECERLRELVQEVGYANG